jgi:hypothetical protein
LSRKSLAAAIEIERIYPFIPNCLASREECFFFAPLFSSCSIRHLQNNLYPVSITRIIMVGDDFVYNEDKLSGNAPLPIEHVEGSACCNVISFFIMGIGLCFSIVVLQLSFMAVGIFAMIPIEEWAGSYNLIVQIIVGIPLFLIFILVLSIIFYIIGFINRFGVERISKMKQPRNRKWIVLTGLIVYVIGLILIQTIFGFTMNVEHPESYWLGLGSIAVTNAIEWLCFFLVGSIGYFVAIKLSVFRNKTQV